jgi:hypothetical protein
VRELLKIIEPHRPNCPNPCPQRGQADYCHTDNCPISKERDEYYRRRREENAKKQAEISAICESIKSRKHRSISIVSIMAKTMTGGRYE